MGQLGTKSDRIGGIVATITGIAEQTNLLALNAAIEAAATRETAASAEALAGAAQRLNALVARFKLHG